MAKKPSAKNPNIPKVPKDKTTFGIGEWYGRSFLNMTPDERTQMAADAKSGKVRLRPCPFRSTPDTPVKCSKKGGVCSVRPYTKSGLTGEVSAVTGADGSLRTTCPHRFGEHGDVIKWISKTLLKTDSPRIVAEVGFLEREALDESVVLAMQSEPVKPIDQPITDATNLVSDEIDEDGGATEDVGRIDKVLIHPDHDPLVWCALEIQAVYFSGKSMAGDFTAIANHSGDGLPYPAGNRHPDYRSSGPKRLMPQLQIKVPTLRRWGKKMAVLVDQSFFYALGKMEGVSHPSNADIAWFIVRFEESEGDAQLVPHEVRFTTLERAVEGLTAGKPVTLDKFEARIKDKLK